jgi:hypothetical protein
MVWLSCARNIEASKAVPTSPNTTIDDFDGRLSLDLDQEDKKAPIDQ